MGNVDLWRALDGVSDRVRPWIVLASHCGLRVCEIARLRVEDILYTARPPMLVIHGKGAVPGIVPLPDFAARELRAARLPAHGWAFRRRDGRPGRNQAWVISQLIGEELRGLGIAASGHQLRHWYGTETLRANGGNLRETQEMLRHASPASTAVYTLILPIDAARTANKLPVPKRLRAAG